MTDPNPFKSPLETTRRRPFFSRLWYASKCGIRGFQNQMLRDNVPPSDQLRSLVLLVLLLLFFLLVMLAVVLGVGSEIYTYLQRMRN